MLDAHSSRNSEWNFDIYFEFVEVRSFTTDSNLLQPTVGVNRTPSDVTFSRVYTLISMSHVTLAQGVLRTSTTCHLHVVVVLILFDPLLCTLHRLSHLPFHSPVLHLHLPCGLIR